MSDALVSHKILVSKMNIGRPEQRSVLSSLRLIASSVCIYNVHFNTLINNFACLLIKGASIYFVTRRTLFQFFLYKLKCFNRYSFFYCCGSDTIYRNSLSCFYLYSSMLHMILQGAPAATLLLGISLLTILPAPMIQLSPIVTPGRMMLLHPIKQFCPMLIGP